MESHARPLAHATTAPAGSRPLPALQQTMQMQMHQPAASMQSLAPTSGAPLAALQPSVAAPPGGASEWPAHLYSTAPAAAMPASGGAATIDWSGYAYPMKESDAMSGVAGAPTTMTAGGEPYDYYAYQQAAAAAAAAAAASIQQQPQTTTSAYTDAYGGAVDMHTYQAAYAAAMGMMAPTQTAPSYYAGAIYDPVSYAMPMSILTPPVTPQSAGYAAAATPTSMGVGVGWHAMQLASPSRMQAMVQLQKGFGSTGHGAEPGPRERRERHSDDSVDKDPLTYKTEVCRTHLSTGHCDYGGTCQFAHGVMELRSREFDSKYKTELCKNFYLFGPASCFFASRCKFIHDEYRVRAGEYEFWLVSPAENLVRVELVDPRNTQRLEQLTSLVTSPPKPPVSPLRPTERTLFQRQVDEEKSKYDALPTVTNEMEQMKIDRENTRATATNEATQQSDEPGAQAAPLADSHPEIRTSFRAPSTTSPPNNTRHCLSPAIHPSSPSASNARLRSPSVTRVLLEESLPPSTFPPPMATLVQTMMHSPKQSPSHHAQEQRRVRLMELARTTQAEASCTEEVSTSKNAGVEQRSEMAAQRGASEKTQASSMQTSVTPSPISSSASHLPSVEEQKSAPTAPSALADPPSMTSAAPAASDAVSAPAFQRMSTQDVRVQLEDGSVPVEPMASRSAFRDHRGHRRNFLGGRRGGGGSWARHDIDTSLFQPHSFPVQFSVPFAQMPTGMPPTMLPYALPFDAGYVRVSNSPLAIDTGTDGVYVGGQTQRRASLPTMTRPHADAPHAYAHSHPSAVADTNGGGGGGESSAADAADCGEVSPTASSPYTTIAHHRLRSLNAHPDTTGFSSSSPSHSSVSPLSGCSRIVTISPTHVLSPTFQSPQLSSHALTGSGVQHVADGLSPRCFYQQQSLLHHLPLFEDQARTTTHENQPPPQQQQPQPHVHTRDDGKGLEMKQSQAVSGGDPSQLAREASSATTIAPDDPLPTSAAHNSSE